MIKKNVFLLIFIVFNSLLFGQTSSMSEIKLSSTYDLIDNYLNDNIERGVIPGGVFLVAEKGKVKYFKSFGFDDKTLNKPYKKDDIFRIASMTKGLTVVSILQLMEKKKLDLEDPVSKYIPSFKNTVVLDAFNATDSSFTTVDVNNELTIKNLLTHTSGIYYGGFEKDTLRAIYTKNDLMGFGLSSEKWTTEQMVDKIAVAPLAFQPGSQWKYGLNMEVLGRIIEVVSKSNLDVYFKDHIIEPLGMTDTYFYIPKEKQDRLAKMHASDTVQNIVESPFFNYPFMPANNHFAGGGGLSSSTIDYARFCMALANKGALNGKRILKKKTVELINQTQLSELDKNNKGYMSQVDEIGFGLGYQVIKKENPQLFPYSKGTFSWGGVFNTKYWIDPKKELVFVGMTQMFAFDNSAFWENLMEEIYEVIEKN